MTTYFRSGIAALAFAATLASGLTAANAADRRVQIINQTGYTIVAFYGSSSDNWEEDILGNDVLASGDSYVVNFDDGTGACNFDFRAEFEDGDVVEDYGIDVCTIETYTFQ